MRVLILSSTVQGYQNGSLAFTAPDDIKLDTGFLDRLNSSYRSIFDYDVTFIHITATTNQLGYFYSLPKLKIDAITAMENGRTLICFPQVEDFCSTGRRGEHGHQAYGWLESFGIKLRDNAGENIQPIDGGRSRHIQEYLEYATKYYRIILKSHITPSSKLAVVENTDVLVGAEFKVDNGTLVILPPPVFNTDNYSSVMLQLMELSRIYYDRAQRKVRIENMPDWLDAYNVPRVKEIVHQISHLEKEKSKYDLIAYALYGTGDELVISVAAMLEDIGLDVKRQERSANIDLLAKHDGLNHRFAIEVTGLKDVVRKDSNKVSQVWKHITDCHGTDRQQDRIIIVANTEYHLNPKQRKREGYTPEVISLLEQNDVLLMTTIQLFDLWKAIYDKKISKENVIRDLYRKRGLYKNPHYHQKRSRNPNDTT